MNLKEHLELWANIEAFAFDEPNATITFSKKLASQQKWSPDYTRRVIEEYRKFIFLCCISPNGASPSKAVDEAWHLHLTYTQSYWNAFCKKTLGRNIHHYPSAGGEKEDHKHTHWYAETLSLYGSVFGVQPPADIWPPPQPVKQWQSWSIPEQPYQVEKNMVIIVVVLLLLPFGICYLLSGKLSPFSFNGPEFLVFYAFLGMAVLIAHYLLRNDKFTFIKKVVDELSFSDMNIFQLTHIAYGKERALQTCLVDLYRRELVTVNDLRKIVVHKNRYQAPEKEENPLVPALLVKADGSSVYYKAVVKDWYKQQSFEHPAVEKLFKFTEQNEPRYKRYLVVLIALFLGFARIMQGWMNHRPVLFLFLEIIALVGVAVLISYHLSTNKLLHLKLKAFLLDKAGSKQLHADGVINDFAINGRGVLKWLPGDLMLESMLVLFPIVRPPAISWDSGSSGSGSGSDGSGGSCSGGGGDSGCGGGGCGGCGGGGGD